MELVNNISGIYSWITGEPQEFSLKNLSNNSVLNIANECNGLLSEVNNGDEKKGIEKIMMPQLAVVGSQSSGKSSLLNNIMAMPDLLPTGRDMVTRSPIRLCLHKTKTTDGYIEFGTYNDAGWAVEKKITLTMPNPTTAEIQEVRENIKAKTIEIAGAQMNISHTPIVLQIYTPNVPDLILIDLPGLVMTSCVDKGQPSDIDEQIQNLALSYVKNPKTIVLLVMQASNDLQTDIGLAFLKKHDVNRNIVGIFTKPDLMNSDSHVGDYLLGKTSSNLMLQHGYFVVKNKSSSDTSSDILKSTDIEKKYFQNHFEYKKSIYQNRVGYNSLIAELTKILVAAINNNIPSVMSEVALLETDIRKKIDVLGKGPPTSKESQLSEINLYVNAFCHKLNECIESQGTDPNIGREIKQVFDDYRIKLDTITPFLTKTALYNDAYFNDIIRNFEGYHMSFSIHPVDLLERCISDPKNKPIWVLRHNCIDCTSSISKLLETSITKISHDEQFGRFPELANFLVKSLTDELINPSTKNTEGKIDELLGAESDFIWTNSTEFEIALKKFSGQATNITNLKELLEAYYQTIKNTMKNLIPKYIMSFLIRSVQRKMMHYLTQTLVKEDKVHLLREDPGIEKQRKYYESLFNRIQAIKKLFVNK
ncbi:MAG: dynamin family protein [Edafosvirus sp.]|uniref:Dynamin family protein n=1 Tax=Edafosvirus sp. TaxID=2487765 RepID=A0A3G4ZVI6_9VIRU|nr:MAG: dynamin family protein [Edafosvirus sp.]